MANHTLIGRLIVLLCLSVVLDDSVEAQVNPNGSRTLVITAERLVDALRDQGVATAAIRNVDPDGIPILCATGELEDALQSPALQSPDGAALPEGMRGWQTIPTVVRPDGVDGFVLEVDMNKPVDAVAIVLTFVFIGPDQSDGFDLTPVPLRDDGLEGDRVAGDYVFTLGPIRVNTEYPQDIVFMQDYPDGLAFQHLGQIQVKETDGAAVRGFLLDPEIGILRSDIPADASTTRLSPDIQVSRHLINVRTSLRGAQRFLRGGPITLKDVTASIYSALPDVFDFLVFLSTNKLERVPLFSRSNFTAGLHRTVVIDYLGTGRGLRNSAPSWGSEGKLLSVNVADTASRGINTNNITHEIMHQWAAFADRGRLGINYDSAHYSPRSNVGSIVGGQLWFENLDGTFSMLCDPSQGRGALFFAPKLDRYLMGLIPGEQVPPIRVYDASLPVGTHMCWFGPESFDEILVDVTIEDFQNLNGVRSPGPATAQRDFRIGFVAESHDRFLSPTEIKFYEVLAETYSARIPAGEPAPYIYYGPQLVSIDRFFGEGTAWRTRVFLEVEIDIKPGSDLNPINPSSHGLVPVALLGSDTFHVAEVDANVLAFGPGRAALEHSHGPHLADVNGDGLADLVSHYRTQETGIAVGDVEACLVGETVDGMPFEGCDRVNTTLTSFP